MRFTKLINHIAGGLDIAIVITDISFVRGNGIHFNSGIRVSLVMRVGIIPTTKIDMSCNDNYSVSFGMEVGTNTNLEDIVVCLDIGPAIAIDPAFCRLNIVALSFPTGYNDPTLVSSVFYLD